MPTPIQTDNIGGIKIPKPQSNVYQSAASVRTDAIKEETAVTGHNVFRPDIYRVSEGYLN